MRAIKKSVFGLLTIIFVINSNIFGQQLLNGNFEGWEYIHTYPDYVQYKPNNWAVYSKASSDGKYFGDRVSNTKEGEYAIFLQSIGSGITGKSTPSFLTYGELLGKNWNVKPNSWGVPYKSRPSKVIGEYKFYNDQHQEDAGYAYILLKKYNQTTKQSDTVGYGTHTFSITSTDITKYEPAGYIPFEMQIEYRDEIAQPDTMILVFVSTKYFSLSEVEFDYGLFFLDNLSLVEDPALISNKNEVEIALSLYPNPTNAILQISTSLQIAKLVVYQSNGTKVLETKATQSINVSVLPDGLYMLEIWDVDGKRIVKKFEKR